MLFNMKQSSWCLVSLIVFFFSLENSWSEKTSTSTTVGEPQISENSIGMKLVTIPAGTFEMGTSAPRIDGWDEEPAHKVTISHPFRISETEVTVQQFQKFRPGFKGSVRVEPYITGVSWYEAQAFCKWLSEKEGRTYRLPTEAEWVHAARAKGKQPKKDYNCRVTQGSKLIKGQSLISIKTGRSNGWGLHNYIGNVQEVVQTPAGLKAQGGAYLDSFSKCRISLKKPVNAKGDKATGFRIVLDLGRG